ncbi:hypothetical protein IFT48_34085 [Pseudomonas fluorescens]|uniref:hypothetical protein n=1 Tax=Pseudomonas fluorescens TaxID=294 RepID=UPI00190331F4|nr:hypothetical protein [Pseudomonas fluorescens]MBD8095032.1 hypothetical protein [Pseudomonas fluorescens]MBD8720844.1 hypothetical protein [Pseudomonas fluorescens]
MLNFSFGFQLIRPLFEQLLSPAHVTVALSTSSVATTGEKALGSVPTQNVARPENDRRTAEQIILDNPILKNLGSQKDIHLALIKERLGDWTASNPDPASRADAAYNAARVLNWIDTSLTAVGEDRGHYSNNGVLEGYTSNGNAAFGTPAGAWEGFIEQGYHALNRDHLLEWTNDANVTAEGNYRDTYR